MRRPWTTLAVTAAAAATVALTAGCGTVSKVTSCGRILDDAVAAATLASQGEFVQLGNNSGQYAAAFRDAANNATDAEVAAAMNAVAADLEAIRDVDFNQPLDPTTVALVDRIPVSVESLQQACTNFE